MSFVQQQDAGSLLPPFISRLVARRPRSPHPTPPLSLPPLPSPPPFRSEADITAYATACLKALGLSHWSFGWDRAIRRLGCCCARSARITLSRYFVAHYLSKNPELIRRTLLHELAHALCWQHHRTIGHGPHWRAMCAALGIPDERSTTSCESFAPSQSAPRYALVHSETGEVYRYYRRRPTKLTPAYLATCYIPGHKEHTLGKLSLITLAEQRND